MEIHHIHLDTISSTNDWAMEHLTSFDPKKITLITADKQTEGRGQFGRKWFSPHSLNLYASFCFFVEKKENPLFFTALLSNAAKEMLKEIGIESKIKWPNDLLVNDKKIAGILCQTTSMPPSLGVVIGIGLNVNMPLPLLEVIDQPATSVLVETAKEWNVGEIANLLKEFFKKAIL